MAFFDNVHSVICDGAETIVKPEEALLNIAIVEAARKSDMEGKIVKL